MRFLSRLILLATIALFALAGPAPASRGGSGYSRSSSHSSGKTTRVRGYYRKDGTYVHPHLRRAPGTSTYGSTSPRHHAPRSYHSLARSSWRSASHSSTWHGQSSRAGGFYGLERDSHGHVKRSESAKLAFRRRHPCPSTGRTYGPCPGYVIDHIKALKHGGADSPENMQWQTVQAAKAKDKWE